MNEESEDDGMLIIDTWNASLVLEEKTITVSQ